MTRWSWLVLALGLLDPGPQAFAVEEPGGASERQIKKLIDQLVSPNPKPITGDEDEKEAPDYRLPPGFNRRKQAPVHQACRKLEELGPVAFPFLIERWQDRRYCRTVSHALSGYCYNQTVGDVCQAILFDQLQPYGVFPPGDGDPRGRPRRPDYPTRFLSSQKKARQWWEKNKTKSLYQMQREVLDWVTGEEAKRPQDYTDRERQRLQQIRKELLQAGKPLPPGKYELVDIEK